MWLWTAQNAFLSETDPLTEKRWADRHGIAYGKKLKKTGNIEGHLTYSKLHRTGKLLRGLNVKVKGNQIIIGNRVRYAQEHEEGGQSKKATIKAPYVRGGAHAVVTGGNIHARPFMNPSKRVLKAPNLLIHKKIRSYGWSIGAK